MSNSKVVSSTGSPSTPSLAGPGIERDAVDFEAAGGRVARFEAPQNGADAGRQFARIERLGQVIVGAEFEADDAVHILAARGEHQDRHLALLPQPAQDLEAIDDRAA